MPKLSEQPRITPATTPAEAFEQALQALHPEIAAVAHGLYDDTNSTMKEVAPSTDDDHSNGGDREGDIEDSWTPPPPLHPVIQKITATIKHHLSNGYQMNHFPDDPIIERFLESTRPHFKDRRTYVQFLREIDEISNQTDHEGNDVSGYTIVHITRKIQGKELNTVLKTLEDVKNTPIEQRYKTALEMEEALKKIVAEREFTYGDNWRAQKRITPENVMSMRHESITEIVTPRLTTNSLDLKTIIQSIIAIKNEYELRNTIGTVDHEKLREDRMKYGAKGANLVALQVLLKKLEGTILNDAATRLSIPPFQLVPAELYRKWKSGEDITEELQKIYESLGKRDSIIIRSSAVYSEDGENTTGAGIYDSVMINKNHEFIDFMTAVMQVYASCDSENAQQYRHKNGVEYEEMGLVIQRGIEGERKGYLNSTRPYTKKLVEISYESVGFPMTFKKRELNTLAMRGECSFLNIQHVMQFQIDLHRVDHDDRVTITAGRYLSIGMAAEIYFQHPVQMEFINEVDRDRYGFTPHLLQVRPLPAKMFTEQKIKLPSEPHLAEFDATGFCDEVLEILPSSKDNQALAMRGSTIDNSDKTGVVIFSGSFFASPSLHEIRQECPKKGVVMLLTTTREGMGHIETIALENGLVLLCNNVGNTLEQSGAINKLMQHVRSLTMSATGQFTPGKRIRIVANGEIGRVYEVAE